MTGEQCAIRARNGHESHIGLETAVVAKLGGRIRSFSIEQVGEQLVLRGEAISYHVKQLAQQQVMSMTNREILSNRIRVRI